MKFFTVNIEATIDGKNKTDAFNHLLSEVTKIKGVSSAGMTDEDLEKLLQKDEHLQK
jgi:hypothetical protein